MQPGMNPLTPVRSLLGVLVVCGAAGLACGVEEADPTLQLTGTESQPLVSVISDGGVVYDCPASKALVCHVPPGNPANAHTICVGKPAVNAHLSHHPDSLGPCGATDAGTPADAGSPPPPPPVDAGPTCMPINEACTADADCCTSKCTNNVCTPLVN